MNAARSSGVTSRLSNASTFNCARLATAFTAVLLCVGASAEIPIGRETVPVERVSCPPQEFAEIALAGRTFTIPPEAIPESMGGGAPGTPDAEVKIASLVVPGKAKEVAILYRCLLQQSGYGLAAGEPGDTAPVYFTDGMALSGHIFIGQILDEEDERVRIVIVARAEPATEN